MKKICCSLLAFSLVSPFLDAITLREALSAAFKNNFGWSAKKTEKTIAEISASQALISFGPSVSAKITGGRTRTDSKMGDHLNINEENTETSMQLEVNQNLFSGFTTVNTLKGTELADEAAFHKLKKEEQDLVQKVVDAYTEIWCSRKRLEARKKMVENLSNTWQAKQSSLEAGMSTPTDVAGAESKYQRAVSAMIEAETQLMTAESEFASLTGLTADNDMSLPDLRFELPDSYEKLLASALNSNHDIKSARLNEQIAEKELSIARGRLSPSVDASLSARKQLSKVTRMDRRARASESDPKSYSASLSVTIPIFTNGANGNTYSQIDIANQKALKARFEAEDVTINIKKECVVNWNKYKSAIAMIKASRSAVNSAELSSEGSMEETALGMKSNTDIWDQENNLLESRINLAQSQKDKIVAAVKLLSLTGNLSVESLLSYIKNQNS